MLEFGAETPVEPEPPVPTSEPPASEPASEKEPPIKQEEGPKKPSREESLKHIEPLETPKISLEAILAIVISVLFLGMTALFYVVKVSKSSLLKAQKAKYEDLQQQLQGGDLKNIDQKVTDLQKQLAALKKAQSGQLLWSDLAKELRAITEKQVRLTNLATDEKKTAQISGRAKSYLDLAKFILGVESSSKFSQVKITSVSVVEAETGRYINFTLSATFDPNQIKLNPPATKSEETTPTTTDSTAGTATIPKSEGQ